MDLLRRVSNIAPTPAAQLPSDEKGRKSRTSRITSKLAFFKRPLRLKGNSSISVPLGVVILFPVIVVVLVLLLFVRHPSSPGRILMPAGAPPAIRYVRLVRGKHGMGPLEEIPLPSTLIKNT